MHPTTLTTLLSLALHLSTSASTSTSTSTNPLPPHEPTTACFTECNWTYGQCLDHAANTVETQS
ncbi:MAG: hypothetical protein Q9223_006255, partial [Gallowayella weberi]